LLLGIDAHRVAGRPRHRCSFSRFVGIAHKGDRLGSPACKSIGKGIRKSFGSHEESIKMTAAIPRELGGSRCTPPENTTRDPATPYEEIRNHRRARVRRCHQSSILSLPHSAIVAGASSDAERDRPFEAPRPGNQDTDAAWNGSTPIRGIGTGEQGRNGRLGAIPPTGGLDCGCSATKCRTFLCP
jgi:hypothetical protein